MDLFYVVKLKEPKRVTIGVRPLREGEQPILQATAGHLTVFGPVAQSDSPPAAVLVAPVQVVPPVEERSPVREETHVEASNSVEILESAEVRKKKRKEASSGGYVGTSKRRRRLIGEDESDAPDEMSATSAQKNQAESPPLV